MLSKYHRNAILTGYIDSYCLVCESHLRSGEDINGHIAKPIHSKNLDATSYLEKFKGECVRKVKKGYFCEFCNILLSTAAKVGLHVVEKTHIINRGSESLKRSGNNIAFHDILIDEKAWNGLIDDTCAICNTEFDNEHIHKTEISHILNLVQSKVEFGADNNIYRQIDDGSFHCLTCNMVLALNTLSTHFKEDTHLSFYNKSQQTVDVIPENEAKESQDEKLNLQEKQVPIKLEGKKPAPLDLDSKKHELQREILKTEVPVVIAKKQEVSKKPATPTEAKKIEIPVETKKVEKPRLEKVTEGLDEQICKALGAKDYISNDENGKKWCLLCDWTMDSVVITNHVNGRHHQTMLKLHKERLQKKKKSQDQSKSVKVERDEIAPESKNKVEILDSVTKFQKNDVNINFESNTAMCKKCLKYLDFNVQFIEAHIEEHKKTPVKKELGKPTPVLTTPETKKTTTKHEEVRKPQTSKHIEEEKAESRASSVASNKENEEEIEKFAKANNLAYSRGGNKVYCRVCDSRVPASIKNMKEHVSGLHHKNKAAKFFEHKQNTKPVTVKVPMQQFIKNIVAVETGLIKDVVINEKYCINIYSFMMITCVNRLRCEPCEMNLSFDQLDNHKSSSNHERVMCETMVIASMESEFIREVRPDVFHCGYCNIAEETSDLQTHLASTSHREAKTAGSWRLQEYHSEILQHQQQRMQELHLLMLLKMMAEGHVF